MAFEREIDAARRAFGSNDLLRLIGALRGLSRVRIAQYDNSPYRGHNQPDPRHGNPPLLTRQAFEDAWNRIQNDIGRVLNVPNASVRATGAHQALFLYYWVADNIRALSDAADGDLGERRAALPRYRAFLYQWSALERLVPGTHPGTPNSVVNAVARLRNQLNSSAQRLNAVYGPLNSGASGPGQNPPDIPPPDEAFPGDPGAMLDLIPDINIDFPEPEPPLPRRLRTPTREEFLNVFDNAFELYLNSRRGFFGDEAIDAIRDRKDEILGRYIAYLGTFKKPFTGSTRGEEFRKSGLPADQGGEIVEVETTGGTGGQVAAFLRPKVSPIDFMRFMFPSASALKFFANQPDVTDDASGRFGPALHTRSTGQ